jgi:fructose-bisphosphate aldolase class II
VDCCEELRAPVILELAPVELEFISDSFVAMCSDMANKAHIPVVIHLDHGITREDIMRAIHAGFTSVMIDASHYSFEENISVTKGIVELAHPLGISVEGEIGTIGTASNSLEKGANEISYTRPEDAYRFVQETGVDTLAIGIGTAHGLYPKGFVPHLKLDLLAEIKAKVGIPLVLHGGSGNPDEEVAESVKRGINKINISSDMKDAFFQQLRKDIAADTKVLEPMFALPESLAAARAVVAHKIKIFNDADKAQFYRL